MRHPILSPLLLVSLAASGPAFGQASTPAPAPAPAEAKAAPATESSAEVKVGLGIEKYELTGGAETFSVAAGTKLYAWTKVIGASGSVTIAFAKDGKPVFQQKLDVPHSPYRTNAYRTFRAGDAGAWTAKVLSEDGKELGSAAFTVELAKS
jgi:hypothetical protein